MPLGLLLVCLILFALTQPVLAAEPVPERLVFGVVPSQTSKIMKAWFNPLIDHMQQVLDIPVVLYITRDYEDLTDKMESNKVHFGFYGASSYVLARKRLPALQYMLTYLRKTPKGELTDYYKGVILTLKASPLQTLQDLEGKRFGFTDYHSSSGYRYPRYLLIKNGIVPKQYFDQIFMLKKHDRVVSALLSQSIDAGATYTTQLIQSQQEHGDLFRVIAETPPIPNEAFVAAPKVSQSLITSLQKKLTSLKETDAPLKQMREAGFPFYGWSVRDASYYDLVMDVVNFESTEDGS